MKTEVYDKIFNKIISYFFLIITTKQSVNKAIKDVIQRAAKSIQPAINYLIKNKCKKIILGCTEQLLFLHISRLKL